MQEWVLDIFSRSLHKSRGEGVEGRARVVPLRRKVWMRKITLAEGLVLKIQRSMHKRQRLMQRRCSNSDGEIRLLRRSSQRGGSGITALDETFPSVPLKPPTPQFLDYHLGIAGQYSHLVLANGKRRERASDRTVSRITDQNKPMRYIE